MTDQTKKRMVIPTYAEAAGAVGVCKACHLEHFLFSLDENLAEDENRDVWREFLADVLTEQIAHREAAAGAAALRMAAEAVYELQDGDSPDIARAADAVEDLITHEASSALSAFEARVREEAMEEAMEEAACAAERVDETYSDGMKMYGRSNYASARNDAACLIRAIKTKTEPGNGN